jgi:hypothetical protein
MALPTPARRRRYTFSSTVRARGLRVRRGARGRRAGRRAPAVGVLGDAEDGGGRDERREDAGTAATAGAEPGAARGPRLDERRLRAEPLDGAELGCRPRRAGRELGGDRVVEVPADLREQPPARTPRAAEAARELAEVELDGRASRGRAPPRPLS